jgi:hypothetical protein
MQIEQTDNELIIRETPGCLWILAALFLLVGGVFVYGALGGLTDYDRHEAWTLALAFVMGSIGVGVGVWMIYGAPITKVIVNRIEKNVEIRRFGLFGRKNIFYDFDEIERFCLVEEQDDEGIPIWSLGINLTNGETVKISSQPSHDELFKRNFVFQTNEFTQKQIASTAMIFELADESDFKMS